MRELRRENRALRRELRRAAAHRYGSFTPGVAEWEAKWDARPGRRVLFYAPMDLAGSLVRWATAVHATPPVVFTHCGGHARQRSERPDYR